MMKKKMFQLECRSAELSVTNYKLEKQLFDLRSPGLLATIKDDDMLSYYTGLQSEVVFDLLKLSEPPLPYLYSNTEIQEALPVN